MQDLLKWGIFGSAERPQKSPIYWAFRGQCISSEGFTHSHCDRLNVAELLRKNDPSDYLLETKLVS